MSADASTKKVLARSRKISERMLALRDELWPEIENHQLWAWQNRQGYTQIPRTMPLILGIMDDLSSGKPVSSTYLALWCRSYGHSFLTIDKPDSMAFEAGFQGQRAVSTWKARLKIINEMTFIDAKEGPAGKYNYILILNPYFVIQQLRLVDDLRKKYPINPAKYNALLERTLEVGATDLKR